MASGFEALPPRTVGRSNRRQSNNTNPVSSTKSVSLLPSSALGGNRPADENEEQNTLTNRQGNVGVTFSSNHHHHRSTEDMNKVFDDPAHTNLNLPCLLDIANVYSSSIHNYEYLDHTADVLIHTWGTSFVEAFSYAALAFWAHLVDPTSIRIIPPHNVTVPSSSSSSSTATSTTDTSSSSSSSIQIRTIQAKGKDLLDLLFNFLDGCLYAYGSDYFLGGRIRILEFIAPGIDTQDIYGTTNENTDTHTSNSSSSSSVNSLSSSTPTMRITAQCIGECFDPERHRNTQGTEIKAITYSAMTIFARHGEWRSTEENTFDDSNRDDTITLPIPSLSSSPSIAVTVSESGSLASSASSSSTTTLQINYSNNNNNEPQKRPYEEQTLQQDNVTGPPATKKRRGERRDAIDLYFIVDI